MVAIGVSSLLVIQGYITTLLYVAVLTISFWGLLLIGTTRGILGADFLEYRIGKRVYRIPLGSITSIVVAPVEGITVFFGVNIRITWDAGDIIVYTSWFSNRKLILRELIRRTREHNPSVVIDVGNI